MSLQCQPLLLFDTFTIRIHLEVDIDSRGVERTVEVTNAFDVYNRFVDQYVAIKDATHFTRIGVRHTIIVTYVRDRPNTPIISADH
ncbi:hypothetical protein ACJ72_05883 [Emergomyces africanus]|uniref:Uncharacterized protein n=1 Tax=Emergomyces africanus TaxID=1955775 RepID=A0A1B7NT31_9EURO|nr:hypothetical protein ACJ72_05883 [Emergomyces africanus]